MNVIAESSKSKVLHLPMCFNVATATASAFLATAVAVATAVESHGRPHLCQGYEGRHGKRKKE
jgi:hypothetical protein